MRPEQPRIIIGVSGGIAAYKTCSLIRLFTESGCIVRVIPTRAALEFVGKATFEALSGFPVSTEVFDSVPDVAHVRFGQEADLVVVAPATADVLSKAAAGSATDLLTATLLTAQCPVLFAPAMHTEMWEHPATRRNITTIRSDGAMVMDPAVGRLTGSDTGAGRSPEPEDIFSVATLLLDRRDALPRDLVGARVLISAGGTRETLDPVRFLSNRSSGKQGFALARVAVARGASVTLVAGSTHDVVAPAGVALVSITSAEQLQQQMISRAGDADIIIMAAAVADFRPLHSSATKIKKGTDNLESIALVKNPDILVDLVRARADGVLASGTLIVGFAAETGDQHHSVLDYAQEKLAKKGCDLLVVNAVQDGQSFDADNNSGWILDSRGGVESLQLGSKMLISSYIIDRIARVYRAHDVNDGN